MTIQYLLRADLAFGFLDGVPVSTSLPVNLGPFQLNHSPNAGIHLADLGLIEPGQPAREQHDRLFPVSLLYLERRFEYDDEGPPTRYADDSLDRLERLLRLFQPGEISVRRHGLWCVHEDGRQTPGWSFSTHDFRPVKPPIEGLHEYGEYPLDDANLSRLIKFVDRFWSALDRCHANLQLAMARFSSSYEKRDLADRIIDLVIALEALFGDGERRRITQNIARRAAFWLHATESERCAAFATIRKFYGDRSKIVHGCLSDDVTDQRVNLLEDMVRSCLRKFLDWQVQRGKTPRGRELDRLMTGRI